MRPSRTTTIVTLTAGFALLGFCSPLRADDCNSNSIDDAQDIAAGTSQDCDTNGVPDECDLADGVRWRQRSTPGDVPSPRLGHAMAYDAQREVTVMFGGFYYEDEDHFYGDTWEWDGYEWEQVSTDGPAPRYGHALTYDSTRQRIVLVGGGTSQTYADTWEWDGSAWSLCSTCGGPTRSAHGMVYDMARQSIVAFGGNNPSHQNDTWTLPSAEPRTWTQVSTTGPSARENPQMAYDAGNHVSVLLGGFPLDNGETWLWDGSSWQIGATEGPGPSYGHAMAYDAARGVTVLFGGGYYVPVNNRTWEWNGSVWSQRTPGGPPQARWEHAMAYDEARGVIVLFGGATGGEHGSSGFRNDTWEYGPFTDCNTRLCLKTQRLRAAWVSNRHSEAQEGRSTSSAALPLMSFQTEPNDIPDECDIAAGTSEDLDGNGIPDECERPVITCGPPIVLWSPNHELADVSSTITVHDPDEDEVTLSFRVFSDEPETPETGDGTGRHTPDFKDEFPHGRGLLVRSERRGPEDGRSYLFLVAADDGNGHLVTTVCVAAVVPHDQDQESLNDVLAQAAAAASEIQSAIDEGADLPPEGLHEHGLADQLGPHQ